MAVIESGSKSPLVMVIAAAVVGGGVVAAVMTGISKKESEPAAVEPVAVTAPERPEVSRTVEAPPAEAPKPQPKAAAPQPKQVVAKEPRPEPGAQPAPAPVAAAPAVCATCGVVAKVEKVEVKGESSGGGAIVGGVIGGVIGHQAGEGRGKDLATAVGVVGGALAGNEIERNVKKKMQYVVTVTMDDGRTETYTLKSDPALVAGDKVKIVDGKPVKG